MACHDLWQVCASADEGGRLRLWQVGFRHGSRSTQSLFKTAQTKVQSSRRNNNVNKKNVFANWTLLPYYYYFLLDGMGYLLSPCPFQLGTPCPFQLGTRGPEGLL